MNSIFSDHCWACGARFVTADPPGTANEERHHIVPRAFGGENGPQVSLCDSCHSKVHKLALNLVQDTSGWFASREHEQKIRYLANVIANAKKAVQFDPNKKFPVSFKISRTEVEMIERLKSIFGVKSRDDVLRIALRSVYKNYFK